MRHDNTLFHGVLQFIPWGTFDELVERHKTNWRVRHFDTKSPLIALLHTQFCGLNSLRDVEASLVSHSNHLYHLGAKAPRRSTLADANRERSSQVFADLFGIMLSRARRGARKGLTEALVLLDSTCVPLHALSQSWAPDKKRAGACAKLHVSLDANAGLPVHFDITPVRTNDITAAKPLVLTAGATYVFDMGYYDFTWWRDLHDAGCRFVTRLKRHTTLQVLETRRVAADGPILYDRIISITHRMKGSRVNPLKGVTLREVKVRIANGKTLRIISNDLTASAEEIADLYKARWQIELFFKWIKQNLKIRKFLGTSENAVRTQITIALIAYLLLKMAHTAQTAVHSLLRFTRLIAEHLMNRRSIHQLAAPPPRKPDKTDANQLMLC